MTPLSRLHLSSFVMGSLVTGLLFAFFDNFIFDWYRPGNVDTQPITKEGKPTIITEVRPMRRGSEFNFQNELHTSFENYTFDSENTIAPLEFDKVSYILKDTVRVLCWVMTIEKNTDKAMAVNSTWAKRCNKVVYITPDNVTFYFLLISKKTSRQQISHQ